MFYVIKFCGDARQKIADSASDRYEGLLHQVAMEYIPRFDATLVYCFGMDKKSIKELFCVGDWFWNNAEIPGWAEEPLFDATKKTYYYTKPYSEFHGSYYLSPNKNKEAVKILENINSLLDFRDIRITWNRQGGSGLQEHRERKVKKFSIRIDEGMFSGSEDFDSIDELKEKLKTQYKAKRLVPVSYTPWDSKECHEKEAVMVDDLTLLYIYEYQIFEIRRW